MRRACVGGGTYLGRVARRSRRRDWGGDEDDDDDDLGAGVDDEVVLRLRRKQGLLILRSLQQCAI